MKVKSLSHVRLFVTPWTLAHQAPPSMEFSMQEYWNGLPFPSPEDLFDPGMELTSPALAGRFFTAEPPVLPFCLLRILSILVSTITTLPFLLSFEYARRIHNLGPLHWPFSLLELSSFRYMNGLLSVGRLLWQTYLKVQWPIQHVFQTDALFLLHFFPLKNLHNASYNLLFIILFICLP